MKILNPGKEAWQSAKKILCVRLDQMGDLLMTTPALRALKESVPGREITLLSSPSCREIVPLIAEIDRALFYDSPWMKATSLNSQSSKDKAMIRFLRRFHFDAAVIFTAYSQSPLPAAYFC